ncbi:MAG TPA: DedA family protein [Phytomonospora sp.]
MTQNIMQFMEELMSSPWIYLGIFTIALLDGFFPVVPAETAVITAGVYASTTGKPILWLAIVVAAAGAFAGDHISYFIGRTAGGGIRRKMKPGSKKAKLFDWAENALAERGGLVLIIARYIPGGRTATTLITGSVGYPLRRFAFFDSIAAISWGVYSAGIGFFAGHAVEGDPIKGLLLGFGIAVSITAIHETVAYLRKRAKRNREALAEGVVPVVAEPVVAPAPAE